MLCRSAFSIFHAAYRFVHVVRTRIFRLWSSARRELLCALASLPFLAAPLTLHQAPRLYAVDASHWGGAVVSTPRDGHRLVTPWRLHWGRQWRRLEHINALELRAMAPVLHRHFRADIYVLSDSMVAIGVLRKGRSASWHLNTIARQFHYLQLLSGSRLCLQHVASEDNPAHAHFRGLRPALVGHQVLMGQSGTPARSRCPVKVLRRRRLVPPPPHACATLRPTCARHPSGLRALHGITNVLQCFCNGCGASTARLPPSSSGYLCWLTAWKLTFNTSGARMRRVRMRPIRCSASLSSSPCVATHWQDPNGSSSPQGAWCCKIVL